jgi:hypothetical protein
MYRRIGANSSRISAFRQITLMDNVEFVAVDNPVLSENQIRTY